MEKKKQAGLQKQQFDTSTLPLIARPIASNSRVKKTQKLHRDMHLAFVNSALEQKSYVRVFLLRLSWRIDLRSQGNTQDFDELVRQFNFKGLSNDTPAPGLQLRLWISALSHVVSSLERTHSALPQAIITMPWAIMDNQFVKSYTSFIGMLVSARPEYLSLVLERVAQGFTCSAFDCQQFRRDISSDSPKILEPAPSSPLCRNPRLLPLRDA
jgi:RNA polymerase I-specific transcription initiation factor RRN3